MAVSDKNRWILASGGSAASVGTVSVPTATNSQGMGWIVQRGDDSALGQSANDVYLVSHYNAANGGAAYTNGGSVTQSQVSRGATAQISKMIEAPVDNFLYSGPFSTSLTDKKKQASAGNMVRSQSGVSSGEAASPVGIWVNGGWSHLSSSQSATKYDGNVFTGSFGADYAITDSVMAGAALTVENSQMNTAFNQGHLDGGGVSLTPYVAWRITDKLGLSLLAGHSWLGESEDRTVGGNAAGSYGSRRWMAASNLIYNTAINDWAVNLHGGYRWALETADAFTESDTTAVGKSQTHVGEASAGARASRVIDNFEPYAGATLLHDFALSQGQARIGNTGAAAGRNGVEGTIGVNYTVSDSSQLSLEAKETLYTQNSRNGGATLNFRHQF